MLNLNPSLPTQIRRIIAEHGLKETHQAWQTILKQDYEYLGTLFTPLTSTTQHTSTASLPQSSNNKPAEVEAPPTSVSPQQKEKKPVKKAVKQEAPPSPPQEDTVESLVSTKFIPGMKILVKKGEGVPQEEVPLLEPAVLPKFSSAAEAKQWQREQEEKRRVNNQERGIDSETLLTQENLKRWIEVEKLGYAQIARDIVGLPEYRIGEVAKQHGILSETAKRRAAIIGRSKK